MRRLWLLVVLAACTPEEPARQAPQDPVVVYAAYADKTYLPARLSRFTEQTGAPVIVRHAGREAVVDDLIAHEIVPPADVIVTPSIRGVTRAADEGALRPLPDGAVAPSIPAGLQDPDGYWVALAYRVPVIVTDTRHPNVAAPESLDDLGDVRFRGRLCLETGTSLVNRTVIASLINARGTRPAELLVRSWVANLATTPFASGSALLAAIEEGRCAVGLVDSRSYLRARRDNPQTATAAFAPSGAGIDVEAAGIGRHARNPDGAAALIAWLLADEFQRRHSDDTLQSPASDAVADAYAASLSFDRASMSRAGTDLARSDAEALRLAERARLD